MSKDIDPTVEAVALINYLEKRGLTEREACGVMGIALCGFLLGREAQEEFLRTLKDEFADINAKPEHLQ